MDFLELTAIFSGIISVWFSRKESIWVYPTGLVGTILYVYLSFKGDLFGEATVNLYYTIMSVYGWYNWMRRNNDAQLVVQIQFATGREWKQHLAFFVSIYLVIFFFLSYIQTAFAPGAIPWADALASASAFTGMWLMTKKKVESWIWWIITNITSIPLYFIKGYAFTSFQFIVLLILAIAGLITWNKKAKQ